MVAGSTKKKVVKKKTSRKSSVKKKSHVKGAANQTVVGKQPGKKSPAMKGQQSKSKEHAPDDSKFKLNAVIAINDVKKLFSELGKRLEVANDIALDASEVRMIDTAVFQLLLAFVKKIENQGGSIVWVTPSDEFLNRAHMLGLANELGLKEV